jgi:tetratricopeptide (TPR) repeat protein
VRQRLAISSGNGSIRLMRLTLFPILALTLGNLVSGPAWTAISDVLPDERERYEECIVKAQADPEQAFEDALAWRDLGGGGPAEHCIAMSLLALGYSEDAASRLDALSRRADAGTPDQRTDLLLQAGDAWMDARRGRIAVDTYSAALMLTPRRADVWAARAQARMMIEDWEMAVSDLDAALTFENNNPEYYVLRSAARKALGQDALAREDIDSALRYDPDNPDALAERGMMRVAIGDENGARQDWIGVLTLAPESPAADVARLGIEQMEVNIEPDFGEE